MDCPAHITGRQNFASQFHEFSVLHFLPSLLCRSHNNTAHTDTQVYVRNICPYKRRNVLHFLSFETI